MPAPSKVILPVPLQAPDALPTFVERCLADGVKLICIAGPGADQVEDEILSLLVGDASDRSRFLMTTVHEDEPFDAVVAFATAWSGDAGAAGETPDVVHL